MPLHDAVGINCRNGATTENQGSVSSILAKGCVLMFVHVCYLTRHEHPSLVEEKVMVYYYYSKQSNYIITILLTRTIL